MNRVALLCLFFISIPAYCEVSAEVLCFTSDGNKPVRFEMRTYHDDQAKWSGVFVKYRGAKSAITLVPKNDDVEEISPGRPDQVTTTWYEVYGGKITGEYEMMSQGANIYSMTYENYKIRKKMAFLFNPEASGGGGKECVW